MRFDVFTAVAGELASLNGSSGEDRPVAVGRKRSEQSRLLPATSRLLSLRFKAVTQRPTSDSSVLLRTFASSECFCSGGIANMLFEEQISDYQGSRQHRDSSTIF